MTTTLYRPVGQGELDLIEETKWKAFPPRLEGQPIFYPVLFREYAQQIARDWNTGDPNSQFVGYVTEFDVQTTFLDAYEVQTVGGPIHQEYWIPAEKLEEFNQAIVGTIRVVDEYRDKENTNAN